MCFSFIFFCSKLHCCFYVLFFIFFQRPDHQEYISKIIWMSFSVVMVTQKKHQVLLLYHSGVQVRLTSYSYHVFVATVSCFICVCVVCLVKVSLLKRGSIVELRNAKGRSSCTTVSGLNRNDFYLFTDTDCAFFF